MKLKLRFFCPQKLYLLIVCAIIFIPTHPTFAQRHTTKHKKYVAKKSSSFASKPSVITSSALETGVNAPNRLDACIQRNRKLVADIAALNELLTRQSNQIVNGEGTANYYKMLLKNVRDSIQMTQKNYDGYVAKTSSQMKDMRDSLASYYQLRNQVSRDKQKVVRDTNVVRVYNMPYDQVRVKVLRKVLDEGLGLVIERNTDEGFLVSKVFKDRKSNGLMKKTIETRVDCDIKMVQHPYQDDKTLFYATTRVQESNGNNSFVEITDPQLIKDYQKKLLKFFDDFLVSK